MPPDRESLNLGNKPLIEVGLVAAFMLIIFVSIAAYLLVRSFRIRKYLIHDLIPRTNALFGAQNPEQVVWRWGK